MGCGLTVGLLVVGTGLVVSGADGSRLFSDSVVGRALFSSSVDGIMVIVGPDVGRLVVVDGDGVGMSREKAGGSSSREKAGGSSSRLGEKAGGRICLCAGGFVGCGLY